MKQFKITEDIRERRLTEWAETQGDQVKERITANIGKQHSYALKAVSVWSGRPMVDVLKYAIDLVVQETNAVRGISDE